MKPGQGQSPSILSSSLYRVEDLAVLANFTLSLSGASLPRSQESALDILRETTGAEAAELFLAEPGGRGMVLTCHRGLFRQAFFQITRFNPGKGFPGQALVHPEPILTRALLEDPRYLRTRVKEKGFRACLFVPLRSPHEVIGSLGVTFRRPDADLDRAFHFLSWASVPLAMRLDSGLLHAREAVGAYGLEPGNDLEGGFNRMLGAILRQMVRQSDAKGGALHLLDLKGKGRAWRVSEGISSAFQCPLLESDNFQSCPAVAEGHGVALYGPRKSWLLPCQHCRGQGPVSYCIPMIIDGEAIGLIQVAYLGDSILPPTRDMVILEKVAEGAGRPIRDAWKYLEGRRCGELPYPQGLQRGTGLPFPSDRPAPARLAPSQPGAGGRAIPDLDIRCLGPLELYCRGSLIPLDQVTRRKALTLLKILLTYDGRPVPKDTLIELLWPETEPEAGAVRLRVVVHALRRLIEPPGLRGKWAFIRNEGDRYYFDAQAPCRVDVKEFRTQVGLGQRAETQGNSETAIHAYKAAVQLYRGDFLEDEPFADWCWTEREHIRETCLDALKRLADLCGKAGEWEQGLKHLRHALRIDPLREEVHRELMRALWTIGRRDGALRQYEVCRKLLERELDVTPLPETRQLVQQIRHSPRPERPPEAGAKLL